METNASKIEWERSWNKLFGSYPINDEYRAEYMVLNHDFGYGPSFMVCLHCSARLLGLSIMLSLYVMLHSNVLRVYHFASLVVSTPE